MRIDEQTFCFLGKNSYFKGILNLHGEVHVNCHIDGEVNVLTNDTLSIEPHALIQGKLSAENIDIYGKVTGEVNANGTLRIFPTAFIEGKISAKSLIIKPGARINITGHTKN